MTKEKNLQDIKQNNRNNASSSGIKINIREQDKPKIRAEYLEIITNFTDAFIKKDFSLGQYKICLDYFYEDGLKYLTYEELKEIEKQADQETGLDLEYDSEAEEDNSSEGGYWEEASDQEAAEREWERQQAERQAEYQAAAEQQAESSTSRSTENQEEPTELSESGKEIMKIINSALVSTEPSGSGKDILNFYYKAQPVINDGEPLGWGDISPEAEERGKERQSANKLYRMTEKDRKELAKQYEGLDKILFDRLVDKVGTRQDSTPQFLVNFALANLPIFGGSISYSAVDNLWIELEKSFSIAEVKEIFAQANQESQQKLQLAANQITRMEKNYQEQLANEGKKLTERTNELRKVQVEASAVKEQLQDLAKNQAEQLTKETEALGQKQKALESKERVEYQQIKKEYEEELVKAKNQAEQLEIKDKAISNYARLIYQYKTEEEILKGEYLVLSKKWGILNTEKGIYLVDKAERNAKIRNLETELNSEKRERQTDKNIHERERTDWKKHEKNLIENKKQAEAEREQYRLDFLKIQTERDELLKTVSPQWLRTIFGRIDWMCGTQLETNGPQFWGKTVFWTKLVLFTLFLAISLWVISWIIRILAAVWRNCKAAFVKKQDTASVLKELIGGIKEAKDSLKRSKKKTPTIAEENEEEEEIFEIKAEAKPKLPKKARVLRSNTKVKPKPKPK